AGFHSGCGIKCQTKVSGPVQCITTRSCSEIQRSLSECHWYNYTFGGTLLAPCFPSIHSPYSGWPSGWGKKSIGNSPDTLRHLLSGPTSPAKCFQGENIETWKLQPIN